MRVTRTDKNQASILKDFRAVPGCKARDLSGVGKDFPDIIVAFMGVNVLFEIKNRKGKNKLSSGQKEFLETWPGPAFKINTFDEGFDYLMGVVKGETNELR